MSYNDADPFGTNESSPSVSWKDKPEGYEVDALVVDVPKVVQATVFETGKPAVWDDGEPRMTTVTGVEVNGERLSLWAGIPSNLFAAICAAQRAAGARVLPGGRLRIRITANPTVKDKARHFSATYLPPDAFATAPAPQVETRAAVTDTVRTHALPTPPVAPADNPIQALAALKEKIAPLIAAGLQPAQIAAVPGIVGPDGAPLTPELVSTILALP